MLYNSVMATITKKQLLKMLKAANRQLTLGQPYIRGGAHLTSKKDREQKQSNTVRQHGQRLDTD